MLRAGHTRAATCAPLDTQSAAPPPGATRPPWCKDCTYSIYLAAEAQPPHVPCSQHLHPPQNRLASSGSSLPPCSTLTTDCPHPHCLPTRFCDYCYRWACTQCTRSIKGRAAIAASLVGTLQSAHVSMQLHSQAPDQLLRRLAASARQ